MIAIPVSLIDRDDLGLLERALIPLIIRHTLIWGDKPSDIVAPQLAQMLRHSPREVVEALDSLVKKGLLKTIRRKTPNGMMIHYALAPLETIQNIPAAASTPAEYIDSNYYLNLSNDLFTELHAFALEMLDKEGLRREIFEDFNLYQRTKNNRSFDWYAEFERWVRKELSSTAPALICESALQETKPTTEEFETARYFIAQLAAIDPQFEAPFDVMSWAKEIKLLVDTGGYRTQDVISAIDWLFSAKGDWFRPNVPDAKHLRKHFKRLISHTRSYRDGKPRLPDGVDLFDLYEQM
jgi:hypothetical protein